MMAGIMELSWANSVWESAYALIVLKHGFFRTVVLQFASCSPKRWRSGLAKARKPLLSGIIWMWMPIGLLLDQFNCFGWYGCKPGNGKNEVMRRIRFLHEF